MEFRIPAQLFCLGLLLSCSYEALGCHGRCRGSKRTPTTSRARSSSSADASGGSTRAVEKSGDPADEPDIESFVRSSRNRSEGEVVGRIKRGLAVEAQMRDGRLDERTYDKFAGAVELLGQQKRLGAFHTVRPVLIQAKTSSLLAWEQHAQGLEDQLEQSNVSLEKLRAREKESVAHTTALVRERDGLLSHVTELERNLATAQEQAGSAGERATAATAEHTRQLADRDATIAELRADTTARNQELERARNDLARQTERTTVAAEAERATRAQELQSFREQSERQLGEANAQTRTATDEITRLRQELALGTNEQLRTVREREQQATNAAENAQRENGTCETRHAQEIAGLRTNLAAAQTQAQEARTAAETQRAAVAQRDATNTQLLRDLEMTRRELNDMRTVLAALPSQRGQRATRISGVAGAATPTTSPAADGVASSRPDSRSKPAAGRGCAQQTPRSTVGGVAPEQR